MPEQQLERLLASGGNGQFSSHNPDGNTFYSNNPAYVSLRRRNT